MKEHVLAIDLGTYNSAATILVHSNDEISELKMIDKENQSENSPENMKSFPSFVYYNEKGMVEKIGIEAKKELTKDPEYVIWGVKRLLGKSYKEAKKSGELDRFSYKTDPHPENGKCLIVLGDEKFLPEKVCGDIIKAIKEYTEKETGFKFENAIISVPAYFDAANSTPIIQAAKNAGFKKVRTIPEPVAAAIAYDIPTKVRPIKTMVFDLGAGTLDVTTGQIVRKGSHLSDLTFKGEITTGNTQLGGMDMDDRLVKHILNNIGLKNSEISNQESMKIRRVAEKAKIDLSINIQTSISFEVKNQKYTLEISRLDLERALRGENTDLDIIEECRTQVIEALKGPGWTPEMVDQVLLIGGPSCMPCLIDMIREVFHRNPEVLLQMERVEKGELPVHPMEAVAKGAALSVKTRKKIPHPYGYGFVDLDFRYDLKKIIYNPKILVPRGSMYPNMSKEKIINWSSKLATTDIEIIQHMPPSDSSSEYRYLGNLSIALSDMGILNLLEFGTIGISMGINENEELITRLRDINTGRIVEYVGISQLKRVDVTFPRTSPLVASDPTAPEPEYELDMDVLKKLLNWAQMIHRRCKTEIEVIDEFTMAEIRKYVNILHETLNFYVWDAEGNVDLDMARNNYQKVLNDANALLYRASELGLIDDSNELKNLGNDIKKNLIQLKS